MSPGRVPALSLTDNRNSIAAHECGRLAADRRTRSSSQGLPVRNARLWLSGRFGCCFGFIPACPHLSPADREYEDELDDQSLTNWHVAVRSLGPTSAFHLLNLPFVFSIVVHYSSTRVKVGPLRFRKPKPKAPWRTPLNATSPPRACIQSLDTYFGEFYGATMWNTNVQQSEDCLYLNLYIPGNVDPQRKLAVMVWVYGGGFWSGCSTLDVYDGKILASEEEVIVVSMNYRVSVFGFLYLGNENAPGNAGLWDQLLALKWVHMNIEKFGGDPDRITLAARPPRRGQLRAARWPCTGRSFLYEYMKCGNMSHDPNHVRSTERLQLTVPCFQWDLTRVYRCLMEATPEKLRFVPISQSFSSFEFRDAEWSPVMEFADFPWVPVVDGEFLVESPQTSLKHGHFKHTQLLAGSNLDEAIYFIVYQLAVSSIFPLVQALFLQDVFPPTDFFTKHDFIKSRDVWLRSISNLLPRQMLKSSLALQAIIHEYEPEGFPPEPQKWVDSLDKMLGDLQFTCNVNEFALAHSLHGGDTFYYYFTHRATQQVWPKFMGVLHGYEIVSSLFSNHTFLPLSFRTSFSASRTSEFDDRLLSNHRLDFSTERFNYTKEEQELSSRFMRYWANFARTGFVPSLPHSSTSCSSRDPNKNKDGSYTPDTWPPYDPRSMDYMNLTVERDYADGAQRIGHGPRKKECIFWKTLIPNILSASAEVGESFIRWKSQMDRWENEILDWQYHFEHYKKHQMYRQLDAEQLGQCGN
ncbi:Carboxylic ester hydrolase [Aphelenchoides fujianensis]|nr:Carboxylic ester hydrolase [Aphelenchoides fujianensis]